MLATENAIDVLSREQRVRIRKKLIRYGIVVSPLMSSVPIIVVLLLVQSILPPQEVDITPRVILLAATLISSSLFIMWVMNAYLLDHFFGKKNKWLMYVISFGSGFLMVVILFELVVDKHLELSEYHPFVACTVNNIIVWLIIHLIHTLERNSIMQKDKAELQLLSLETKLEAIKRQIQPHFLFNCIANIKALIEQKAEPDKVSNYLSSLSVFLRKSLEIGSENLISVDIDWQLAKNYIDLQQLRFGNSLKIRDNMTETDLQQYRIPIFSLQLLLENIYKHNVTASDRPLTVDITIDSASSILTVRNELRKRKTMGASTGMGLDNLRERTLLLMEEAPVITQTDDFFEVTIKLMKDENSRH